MDKKKIVENRQESVKNTCFIAKNYGRGVTC